MVVTRDLPSPRQAVASLDGPWRFWPDRHRRLPTGPRAPFVTPEERERALGPMRVARVPAPWQAQFDDLRLWAGTAWYERTFNVDAGWRGRRVRLCFGAVDYFCTVWVNGRVAGEHEGGYLPFAVDATDLLRLGAPNTVTVRVLDVGPDDEDGPFPFADIPHGKQSWYGPIGGPWQGTWIEARGTELIEGARVVAETASGRIHVAARGAAPARFRVLDPRGHEVARGAAGAALQASVPDAVPWRPGAGAVYTLQLATADDRWSTTFGFREVGTRDGRVVIDGVPTYLVGALDQDYWDETIATPPSDEALARQLTLARELGLNLLRCHIKPPTPAYLDQADRAGMLVWTELPSWISLEGARSRVIETLDGIVERDANHPSLIAWTIVNEGWGADLAGRAEDRAWLAQLYDHGKRLDPTRLWVENSACPPTYHIRTDLNDFHLYRAVPDQLRSWREWTAAWSADAARTFSPHGDVRSSGEEPRVLSEFGVWGLPNLDHREPWWFETGASVRGDVLRPAGVRERFEAWGLRDVFGSWDAFVRQSQEHQFEGLKAEIEDLRLHPELAGYVITELTDVHWEANGLLDLWRNPKAFHDRLHRITGQTVVIPRPRHTRYRSGERAAVDVVVASTEGHVERQVSWGVPELGLAGAVDAPGCVIFDVPALDRSTKVELSLRVDGAEGPITNATTLWLFPDEPNERPTAVAVASWWGDVASHVARGGRAVVVAADDDALPEDGAIGLERWSDDDDATGWIRSTGLGWVHPRLTEGLPIGPRVDLAFLGITPEQRLRGYGPEQRSDVLAGHLLGWIRDVTATIAAFHHGEGVGIICTFPLLDGDGSDPVATDLLDRLTTLAAEISPTTALDP